MALHGCFPKFYVLVLVTLVLAFCPPSFGQSVDATLSGTITDPSGAIVANAQVKLTNVETDITAVTPSNNSGLYVFSNVHPGQYRMVVEKSGFRQVVLTDLTLNIQDILSRNFKLQLGVVGESVTVSGASEMVNTVSGAVSTVVDDQFVQNMPLNGRSFQSLIALVPGVVFTSDYLGDGQFSVNGQRGDANYFMVDGVSANFGISAQTSFFGTPSLGQTLGGTTPGLTAGGGTNALVSVDAMQEFRIQTSSYAPEFGRSPGAQISIVSKSGANQFHGDVFDYLRNELFDARSYFDYAEPTGGNPALPKPALRQNDFGGVLGGPILKGKTFFFFSFEGLRLRLPQIDGPGAFYTASARAAVAPVYQPFINALPLPDPGAPLIDPTCDNITNPCQAYITAAVSNPSTINATSIRIDHNLTKKITLFARYNHAPSNSAGRAWESVQTKNANTDTMTAGATILLAPNKVNDFRANWSRNTGGYVNSLSNFHGAVVPPTSAFFPPSSPYNTATVSFPNGYYNSVSVGGSTNVQRQVNILDTFAWAVGTHQLKFGIDYRRLSPTAGASAAYYVDPQDFSNDMVNGYTGVFFSFVQDANSARIHNYSLYAQDTWRTSPRLTLTYGLRWEINTPPTLATPGKPTYVMQGIFDSNPLAVVPGALWHTTFGNFAPRVGAAYRVTPKTVVRGGFGLFYDLGYGAVGNAVSSFPYYRPNFVFAPTLPLDLTNPAFAPPPFSTSILPGSNPSAVDPNLQLPFTMQWNAAIEREIGTKQTLTTTYLGSDARRLLRSDYIVPPLFQSSGFGSGWVTAIHNGGYSHYNALQVQFQRRMSHGLQALVSYSFSKSSDLSSSDNDNYVNPGIYAATSISQLVLPPLTPSVFDIRHSISGAVSYEMPAPAWGRAGNAILKGWAIDGLVRASSAPPINITTGLFSPQIGEYQTQANIVPGQPVWIPDSTQPAGKKLNPAAFSSPPVGQMGNFPRNGLRDAYSVDQTDLALRRRFNLTERVKLDVRAEYFNVFNHPMFGAVGSSAIDTLYAQYGFPNSDFGVICRVCSANNAIGGQNSLYATGGPRSGQFTLKIIF